MKLTDYINEHHNGNKAEFARSQGVQPQALNKWVNAKWIVLNGVLYSPRRELITKDNEQ